VRLPLRKVYPLTYRAVEGLTRSIAQRTPIDLPVPARRKQKVSVGVPKRSREEPLHPATDSGGLQG